MLGLLMKAEHLVWKGGARHQGSGPRGGSVFAGTIVFWDVAISTNNGPLSL